MSVDWSFGTHCTGCRACRKPCLDAVAKSKFLPVSKNEARSSSERAVCFLMVCCGAYDVLMVLLSVPALRR